MRSLAVRTTAVLTAVLLSLAGPGLARQGPARAEPGPSEGTYADSVQRNIEIKLKDGRTLRADVHSPADPDTGKPLPGRFPVVIGFTPYGKTPSALAGGIGSGGFNPALVQHGYVAAVVDVPGTGGSEGEFDLFSPDEATAGAEVVRWAAALPNSDGKVGMLGLSYVAIDQLFTAAEVGPDSPLKAVFPMAATPDPYRDLFTSGGALNVLSPLGLVFGYGVTRTLTPFLELPLDPMTALTLAYQHLMQAGPFELTMAKDMLTNGPRRYYDSWWAERAPEKILPKIVANGVAVYLVGGLYDVFQRGEPLLYSGLQNAAAGRPVTAPMEPGQPVSSKYQLLTGPWTHGGMGAGYDLTDLQIRWFDHWLKGRDNGITDTTTPMHVIEPGGATYSTADYPLADAPARKLYLRSGGRLTADAPGGGEPGDSISYTPLSDPCVRSTDQYAAGMLSQLLEGIGMPGVCTGPQSKPTSNDNETTYSTAPLDQPMTLAGPIGVTLRASSTRPETLFALTVEDVAPDGKSTDVTGGAQLGSLRALDTARSWRGTGDGYTYPYHVLTEASRADVPTGEDVRYDVEVRPAFATIPAGHRLRLRIATADFPHLVPLADLPNLLGGKYTIAHDAARPSSIELSVRS
ncbi:CocE/NonD family hydrolase [Actinomadura atramentaria]|uniref:CocE/NonD family hydrolase n=1 Tax=Actinomadura atramentaria TaxID=1990 RepID=UPI00035C9E2E|nr:CocE/NonD family hydrolase [Actinomadura atramentaria]